MRRALLAGVMLWTALAGGPAAAEPARPRVVVIVRGAADDELLREAATRLRAELRAAGFEGVEITLDAVDPAAPTDPGVELPRAAREAGAVAAATLTRSDSGAAVDLWIAAHGAEEPTLRTLTATGPAAPSVVAVRAAEILDASRLGSTAPAGGPAPGPKGAPGSGGATEPVPPATPPPPRPPLMVGLTAEAGVLLLHGGSVGPAAGPFVRVAFGAPPPGRPDEALAARVTLAGPAFAPQLTGAAGELSVRQELAMAEAVYALAVTGPVIPRLSAGLGAYHLHAAGEPRPPYVGAAGDVWSVVVGAGAGLGIRLGDRVAALLDAQILFAEPRPVVQLAGERLGAPGRPSVGGFAGVLIGL